MRRCAIIFLLWLCAASALTAQPWWEGNRVSPMYFGPNALPVPDMLDGRVAPRLYAELAGDIHKGFYGDMTETVSAKVNIPLFTSRVNLSVWMPVVEFYQYTSRALEHFQPREYTERGYQVGNVYVLIALQALMGASLGFVLTVSNSEALKGIAPRQKSTALGLYQAIFAAGMTFIPMIAGFIIEHSDGQFAPAFTFQAVICLSGAILVALYYLSARVRKHQH